jgi:archaellum component FlaC
MNYLNWIKNAKEVTRISEIDEKLAKVIREKSTSNEVLSEKINHLKENMKQNFDGKTKQIEDRVNN